MIIYIKQAINKKWVNSALSCDIYASFEWQSSDHRIVLTRIHLSLCRNKRQTDNVSQWNLSSLANSDISNQYTMTERNKFDTLLKTSERHTPIDKYKKFVTTHTEAAAECITIKSRAKCRPWWELIAIRKKREKYFLIKETGQTLICRNLWNPWEN